MQSVSIHVPSLRATTGCVVLRLHRRAFARLQHFSFLDHAPPRRRPSLSLSLSLFLSLPSPSLRLANWHLSHEQQKKRWKCKISSPISSSSSSSSGVAALSTAPAGELYSTGKDEEEVVLGPPMAGAGAGAHSGAFVDGELGVHGQQQRQQTLEKFDESGRGSSGSSSSSSDLIFLGTGTSEGVPRVSCLTHTSQRCPVCWGAVQLGNKNRRRNTSIILRVATADGTRKNILIDAGKFFYHSALQWFPYYGIRNLDAVIITHSHADAVGGLDDLRDWTNNVQDNVPIYVARRDIEVLGKTHYYLVDTRVVMEGTAVSKLSFNLISEKPFDVLGLKVIPLPVWHGPEYRSLGFRVGNVCYISDVSEIPEETYALLENCDLLILDALRPDRSSATHFGLPQAVEEVRKIRPKRTLFTGMMHTMDHDDINEHLATIGKSEGLDLQLSYDGMRIPVTL